MARFPHIIHFSASTEMVDDIEELTKKFGGVGIPASKSGILRFLVAMGIKKLRSADVDVVLEWLVEEAHKMKEMES